MGYFWIFKFSRFIKFDKLDFFILAILKPIGNISVPLYYFFFNIDRRKKNWFDLKKSKYPHINE